MMKEIFCNKSCAMVILLIFTLAQASKAIPLEDLIARLNSEIAHPVRKDLQIIIQNMKHELDAFKELEE
jgi:hypothetical protein